MAWTIRRKQKGKSYLAPLAEQWVEADAVTEDELFERLRAMVREHDPDLMVIVTVRLMGER